MITATSRSWCASWSSNGLVRIDRATTLDVIVIDSPEWHIVLRALPGNNLKRIRQQVNLLQTPCQEGKNSFM